MINLKAAIDRIDALLADDTDASVTYAALEARLAIERVCYDRLRQAHDYISHDQLSRWQPAGVMNDLIQHVDEHAAETLKLSVSKEPARADVAPEDQEYIEFGIQIGFNAKKLGQLWNALSGLALHVTLPKHREDQLQPYGDKSKIRAKVVQVRAELERLSAGNMVTSGVGEEVHFDCICGEKNRRRRALLKPGSSVFCINPKCVESYRFSIENDEPTFEREGGDTECDSCKAPVFVPQRAVGKMRVGEHKLLKCDECGAENKIVAMPLHARARRTEQPDTPA